MLGDQLEGDYVIHIPLVMTLIVSHTINNHVCLPWMRVLMSYNAIQYEGRWLYQQGPFHTYHTRVLRNEQHVVLPCGCYQSRTQTKGSTLLYTLKKGLNPPPPTTAMHDIEYISPIECTPTPPDSERRDRSVDLTTCSTPVVVDACLILDEKVHYCVLTSLLIGSNEWQSALGVRAV